MKIFHTLCWGSMLNLFPRSHAVQIPLIQGVISISDHSAPGSVHTPNEWRLLSGYRADGPRVVDETDEFRFNVVTDTQDAGCQTLQGFTAECSVLYISPSSLILISLPPAFPCPQLSLPVPPRVSNFLLSLPL